MARPEGKDSLNQIVNVNSTWGIGRDGDLLCHIPEDMRFFKDMTLGKTVIMGRKTLESLPGGRPLPGRRNIVLTRALDKSLLQASASDPAKSPDSFADEHCADKPCKGGDTELLYANDIDMLFSLLPDDSSQVFVIGGESIYRLLLPFCDTFYVTKNDCPLEADTFYPDLDAEPSIELVCKSETRLHKDIHYSFLKYQRSAP